MKVRDLFEERQKDWSYTEKRVKGALQKVTLALQGNDSGAMSRLTKRYERLDKTAKLLKERRDALNAQIKDVGDRVFDAEDALATRIIETVSYTVMLTAAQKAEHKEPTKNIDFESAYGELAKLLPDLQEAAEKILAKYTEIVPAKDTPVGLRVKSKIDEGSVTDKIASWIKSASAFVKSMLSWGASYDAKLNTIKKKYPVPKGN